MGIEEKGTKDTISGKGIPEVRNNVLGSLIRIKLQLKNQYSELLDKSSLDHIRMLLESLKNSEEDDIRDLEQAIELGKVAPDSNEADQDLKRDSALLDHLVQEEKEIDHNDISSVIRGALKMSIDMISLLSLMQEEYKSSQLSHTISILIDRERHNKAELEELYEDYVNEDYW